MRQLKPSVLTRCIAYYINYSGKGPRSTEEALAYLEGSIATSAEINQNILSQISSKLALTAADLSASTLAAEKFLASISIADKIWAEQSAVISRYKTEMEMFMKEVRANHQPPQTNHNDPGTSTRSEPLEDQDKPGHPKRFNVLKDGETKQHKVIPARKGVQQERKSIPSSDGSVDFSPKHLNTIDMTVVWDIVRGMVKKGNVPMPEALYDAITTTINASQGEIYKSLGEFLL